MVVVVGIEVEEEKVEEAGLEEGKSIVEGDCC